MDWQPIETAPIKPFDADHWYKSATPRLLLWDGYHTLGSYGYTQKGKGRWRNACGYVAHPTHWMPLPPPPASSVPPAEASVPSPRAVEAGAREGSGEP